VPGSVARAAAIVTTSSAAVTTHCKRVMKSGLAYL
jgi:hypothetical protein